MVYGINMRLSGRHVCDTPEGILLLQVAAPQPTIHPCGGPYHACCTYRESITHRSRRLTLWNWCGSGSLSSSCVSDRCLPNSSGLLRLLYIGATLAISMHESRPTQSRSSQEAYIYGRGIGSVGLELESERVNVIVFVVLYIYIYV